MAPKRPLPAAGLDTASQKEASQKPKRGFRVGPDNLPDGPWRRKVTKIKQNLIHKAKVKKAYAKIRTEQRRAVASANTAAARDGPEARGDDDEGTGSTDAEIKQQMHPTRELMLKDEDKAQAAVDAGDGEQPTGDGRRRRTRRPGYYDKQLKMAEQRRIEAEERAQEMRRRREEREQKLAARQRFRKAMAKTRGSDGKKKLGRESTLLLDKVKRLVA